jgi:type III restriction enzyme
MPTATTTATDPLRGVIEEGGAGPASNQDRRSGGPTDWVQFIAESHPRVRAYVKNQNLGLEIPYLMAGQRKKYIPDFIVQIDDGHPDPLNIIVEIKGYRGEDAKEKANTLRAYWVPGVNNLKKFGRWGAAEFTVVYEIEAEFTKLVAGICGAEAA